MRFCSQNSIFRRPQRFILMLVFIGLDCISFPLFACTYDEHCPSQCDGSRIIPRGCTPEYQCEPIPAFARDCATAAPPVTFSVNGTQKSIPQTCLLTTDSAVCGPDKPLVLTELTVECVMVSEEASTLAMQRENLETLRIESARICREEIEDKVIDLGVNIAFMAASGTGSGLVDIATTIIGVGTDQALGAGIQTEFAEKASKNLKAWADTFSAGIVSAADLCTFQEELRDVTIPLLEKIWFKSRRELRECRTKETDFLNFPDPVPRSPDLDLDPRDPRPLPEKPVPPSTPPPTPKGYLAACPCEDPMGERVPFVTGMSLSESIALLQRCNLAGFASGARHDDQQAAGIVIEQAPYGGACIAPNSRIGLIQSLGPNIMVGLTIEAPAQRMAVGETLAFEARISYADGSANYLSYGADWLAEKSGRSYPFVINKFTPTEPGEYLITARFEALKSTASILVSPGRTSIGRGNWNVYCTFEGNVIADEGYSTGTMQGPFESQAAADGWIAVHCPSRGCDRAFTCLEDQPGSEDLSAWEPVAPNSESQTESEPAAGSSDNAGWAEQQGSVQDKDDCAAEFVQQAFLRADSALANQQMNEWAQAMREIAASNCRDGRLRSSLSAAADMLQQQQARESKISELARNQPADFDYSGLLQTLTQVLDEANRAQTPSPANNPFPAAAGSSTPGVGAAHPSTPGAQSSGSQTGSSSSACKIIMSRLKENSDKQRNAAWGSPESDRLQAEARTLRIQSCSACGMQGAFCQ